MSNMMEVFKAGDEIDGYCGGVFGRDDYDFKVCVFVTPSYAVFQNADNRGAVLNYYDDIKSDFKRGMFSDTDQ